MGTKWFRQSNEIILCKAVRNMTVKMFKPLIANDNVEYEYALAA